MHRPNENNQRKRLGFIDVAKGMGMLAVIWGHIHTVGWSNIIVYAFDIPLFFFLSGLMFNEKKYPTFNSFLKSRIKSLLIPYAVFSVITWVVWAIFSLTTHSDGNIFTPLLQTVIAQGSGGYLVHNVPLWFVTCLFVVEMIYYFLAKCNDLVNVFLCIIMTVVGYFMLHNSLALDFTKLPWNIEVAFSAMLFYCAGNLFRKHVPLCNITTEISKHKMWVVGIFIASTVAFVIGAMFNGHISLAHNNLGRNVFAFYVVGFCGTISLMLMSIFLDSYACMQKVMGGVKFLGENSFYYMAIHNPIKGFLIVIYARLLRASTDDISVNVWQSFIVFILTIAFSTIVVYIINFIKRHRVGRI